MTSGRVIGKTKETLVEIREVKSRRDLNQFIRLPWRIYRNDPHWIPPLLVEVKAFLDRTRHPFYKHGDATQFLALDNGQAVGRILVSDDPNYNEVHGESRGCFGMFESVDDRRVSAALLDAAAAWLGARGRTAIQGPIDYSLNYTCGLLVEGFDTPPRVMMNHNPPYYAALLESWGLTKAKDVYAWWFDTEDLLERWKRLADWLARRGQIAIRPFRMDDLPAEVARCRQIYLEAMKNNWGTVPLTEAEFDYFVRRMAKIAPPEQALLAEADGRLVGFCLTLPDVNEAIGPLNGRLTRFGLPVGLARLLYRLRKVKTARMMVLVVLDGYRRRGVSELLILKTFDYGRNQLGYRTAELSWTAEDNYLVNRTVEAVGARRYKTYRIYEKNLTP